MKEKLKNKKIIITSLISVIIVFILLITLKDSYAYYGGSNELEIMKATIGKLKPTIDKVYIENENQLYTNNQNPNVTITWTDDNITEYCVTTESTCTDFKPIDSNSKSVTVPITLNGEGNHTVYAYIKNKYGYTSLAGQSSITLDTIPPTVSYAPTSGTYSPKQVITVTPYDSGSGVGAWAVHVYKARALDYSNKDFVKSVDGLTNQASYSVTLEEGTWTIYTIVYDKAGNVINPDPKERADWHYEEYTIKNPSVPAKDAILANRPQSLESEDALTARNATITGSVKDDLRRFVGTYEEVTDNFICFGTSDQNQCKQNMDTYMYRIIGIDTSGRLKLIKATKIDNNGRTTFEWQSGLAVTEKWDKSSLYNGLNDGYFMQNSNYNYMQQTQWTNLIDPTTYYIGSSTTKTNPTLFQNERGESFDNAKTSLMYLSDYLYANNGQADKNNWLFIANGLNENHNSLGNEATAPDANTEWTMTRYGRYGYGSYYAWEVMDSNGAVNWYMVDDGTFAVRPVFYLKSTTRISNGNGTIGTPYIIAP